MAKKYKHIRLPKKFIKTESFYQKGSGRFVPDLPDVNYAEQKPRITRGIQSVKARITEKDEKIALPQDKCKSQLIRGQKLEKRRGDLPARA